jgi:S1-C subfamily serine protease
MSARQAVFALSVALVASSSSHAQSGLLSPDERARCIESMARVEVDSPRGTITGSGTVIDPRGYVLTNFHVVGHKDHQSGTPGVVRAQRYRVAIVRGERETVVDEYVAEVVRGHVRLDLALLRIVARADEALLEENGFTAMPIRDELAPLSTPVWALGFPAGIRTIHLTAGQVAGFENDNANEVSWIRTDTEFNPGNSGGALIDASCRMVGIPTALSSSVEPIELARPSTRIPRAWRDALASGEILRPEPTEGLREIAVLTEIEDHDTSDDFSPDRELRYYRLPSARPGVARISPKLMVATMGPGGRLIREGRGEVLVTASDGPSSLIAVLVPRGRGGRTPTVRIRYTPLQDDDAIAGVETRGGTPLRGTVTRADGSACATYVALFPPSADVDATMARLRGGEAPESELRSMLLGLSALGSDGSFALTAPMGASRLVVIGPHGIELSRELDVTDRKIDLGRIELELQCR